MTTDERLDKLEQQLTAARRRFRWLTVLAGFAVIAATMAAAPNNDDKAYPVLRTRQLVIEDANGKDRATLAVLADGAPGLGMYDENEEARVVLSLTAAGSPSLRLFDANEKGRVTLGVPADGAPGLWMNDENEKTRVILGVLADGAPGLRLNDANGKDRATLAVLADGAPRLWMHDENRKIRTAMGVLADGTPALGMFDENGNTCRMPSLLSDQKTPKAITAQSFTLVGPGGKKAAELEVTTSGPVLRMYDGHGNMRIGLGVVSSGRDYRPAIGFFNENDATLGYVRLGRDMPHFSDPEYMPGLGDPGRLK